MSTVNTAPVQIWDEPATANTPRGWLKRKVSGGTIYLGFYLDYGPDHYRSPHKYWCTERQPCSECQPGTILASRYWPGEAEASRYVTTIEAARAFVETPCRTS